MIGQRYPNKTAYIMTKISLLIDIKSLFLITKHYFKRQ